MASKKESVPPRGAKLIKRALEASKASGVISSPEPIPASLVRKMKLPNGEPLSPAMKELLAFDGDWLGIEYDEDEAEVEAMSLEEVVEEHFGDQAVAAFGEAYEILSEDCVFFGGEFERPACLYVGSADDAGEYAVLTLAWDGTAAQIGGFVPFDVWAAQQLGALERGKAIGDVPAEYAALPQALAEANGDGRVLFTPEAGEADERGEVSDDDDEDGDDEDSDDEDGDDEDSDDEDSDDEDSDDEDKNDEG